MVLKARPRAVGSMLFDISQRISSTSTVANATVEEKVNADKRLMVGRDRPPSVDDGL